MKKCMAWLLAALVLLMGAAAAEEEWHFDMNGAQWGMSFAQVMDLLQLDPQESGLMPLGNEKAGTLEYPDQTVYGYESDDSYVFVDGVLHGLVRDMMLDDAAAADVLVQLMAEHGEPATEGERIFAIMDVLVPGMYAPETFAQANCWERADGTLIYFTSYAEGQYVIFWMDYTDMAAALLPAAE